MSITLSLTLFYGILALLTIQLITNIGLMIDKHITEKKLHEKIKKEQLKCIRGLRKSIEDD